MPDDDDDMHDEDPNALRPVAYAVKTFLLEELARYPTVEEATAFMAKRVNDELDSLTRPKPTRLYPIFADDGAA
jgi:hypothetical protein